MILFVLFLLSTILIYSLLMMSIETKTYQLGVFRVLGLSKIGMVFLILFQSFLFVIPAIIIGILISFAINDFISGLFESNIGVGFDPAPTPNAIGNAILIGFLIPLISSLHPVYNVMKSELSEAMDISHNKSKAVAI
mmetsp:Transcript_25554/g.4262  ORF Transcript_25554/g.4262 Transcript_25554/m.4262 type:complete len:137 (-) Transcript_25554:1581-1991(-)